jgi:hypothetical protein
VDHAPQNRQIPGESSFGAGPQLRGTPHVTDLRIPDPQFSRKTPAHRRSSCPAPLAAPGGQPNPSQWYGASSVEQLRWARCPDDGRLHLLQPAHVSFAVAGRHAQTVCGQWMAAEGLTINSGPSGTLCMTCVIDASAQMPAAGPRSIR